MILILLFLHIEQIKSGYLTFSQGEAAPMVYPNSFCYNDPNNTPREFTVKYDGAFAKKPTLITFFSGFDMGRTLVEFTYSLPINNETMFKISMNCLSTQSIAGLSYSWVAFDDIRITVIDSGIVNMTNKQSQIFTYTHNNTYATQGFVYVQSFGFKGAQDYSLQITSLSTSQVVVSFTANNQNILSIMFQVIIGPAEAFTLSSQLQQNNVYSGQLVGQTVNNIDNHLFFISLNGLKWTSTSYGFRYVVLYTYTATTTQYQFKEWAGSSLASIKYQQVWFNTMNYKALYPFICVKMRVGRKLQSIPQRLSLYINEQQKTYYPGDSQTWNLDPGTTKLNIVALVNCQAQYKIVGFVLKCVDCVKTNQDLSANCINGLNYVQYTIVLSQSEQVYQRLEISVTQSQILITQLVLCPYNTILSLELKRQ